MQLGLVSAILDGWDLDGVLSVLKREGLTCMEAACWPQGKAERRYAGVSHIDCERVLTDAAYKDEVLGKLDSSGIALSALAFYPNTMDGDLEKRTANIAHLKTVIKAANVLGAGRVGTFIGRMSDQNLEDNLEEVKKVWPDILKLAEDEGVQICIENCPMLFGPEQWPGGQNIMTSPANWERVFEILPSKNLGINFDPSHFVWQQMDYIKAVYDFKDKIFHVHFKDIKLLPEKLRTVGIMAYPLDFMAPKIPGLGDVNWSKFVSALTDIGYNGPACIELEDRAFEGSRERVLQSITLSTRYMRNFVI